jgi:hypothetical protein
VNRPWLSYAFTLSFSIVFVQALIFGYDNAGMKGTFVAGAVAYVPLGLFAGILWPRNPVVVSILAGIPTWLFIIALYQCSIIKLFTTSVESIPLVLEPISVSLFFAIGFLIGSKIFSFRAQRQQQGS